MSKFANCCLIQVWLLGTRVVADMHNVYVNYIRVPLDDTILW